MQRSSIKQEPPFGAQPSPRGARPPEHSDSPEAAAPPLPELPSAPRNPLGPSAPTRPAPTGYRGGEPGRDLSLTARRARAQRVPPAHPPESRRLLPARASRGPAALRVPNFSERGACAEGRAPAAPRRPSRLPSPGGAAGPRRSRPTCAAAAGRGLSRSSIGTSCAGLGGDLAMSLWTIGVKPGRAEPRGGAEAGRAEAGRRGAPQRPAMPGSGQKGRGWLAAARPCLLPARSARRGAGGRGTAGGGRGGRAGGGAWG